MVTGVTVALFIHLLGVITLFIAIGILQRGGERVRAASTVEELRLWLDLLKSTGGMFPASFAFILLSGLYMTNESWSFDTPWIVVAIVSVVVMGIIGGAVIGRKLSSIGRAAASAQQISPELALQVARPALWVAATALNGMALGVLWLMSIKPGWTQSIVVVTALAIVGGVIGYALTRRTAGGTRPAHQRS